MSVSVLPFVCVAALAAGFAAFVLALAFARARRRSLFWTSVICFLGSAAVGGGSFARLERIHGELFQGHLSVKTNAELLNRFGAPSRTRFYMARGKRIDCWIYEIRFFQPPVFAQFEMLNGKITATMFSYH